MPRPGPRPYECVRRAWHSDRHQPMRGSIIQEIFRIANEIHSISTKKNKEWQEKLPIVVLKAEEIMYSKANSEAEYADRKTLWDRTNDAINTIIRLDESTETGDLLQPCIEAALNLGCTPRRASRSQRNNHPTCYLSPPTHEPSPGLIHNSNNIRSAIENSSFSTSKNGHLNHSGTKSRAFGCQNNVVSSNSLQCTTDDLTLNESSNGLWSVYPLAYESVMKSVPSTSMPLRLGVSMEDTSVKFRQADCECDLSLRLGSLSAPSQIVENKQLQDFKDFGSSFGKESKINDQTPSMNKNMFFSWVDRNDQFDACSSKFNV